MCYDVSGLDWSAGRMIPAFQMVEHLDVYDLRGATRAVQLAATTCVGLLNRPQPRVYLIFSDDDEYWLKQLMPSPPQTLASQTGNAALNVFLDRYHSEIRGLIIYDPDLVDTINIATTLAGLRDGIVVSPELAQDLQGLYALPLLVDLRTYHWHSPLQAYLWAQQNLLSDCSPRLIAGMRPEIANGLRSFLVATRTFVYWLDTRRCVPDFSAGLLSEKTLAGQIYHSFAPGAIHLGWFVDEPSGVAMTSRAAIAVLASDFFNNLEVWTALQSFHSTETSQAFNETNVEVATDKVYVSFTMSDGDNLQYCQHRLLQLWRDSARGSVPLGWTISPVLLEAAPAMAQYYRDSATPNDELIAGPSGAAYIFPSHWPTASLSQFLQHTGKLMQSMGLTTLSALDTDFLYNTRFPLLSKISLTGMSFTHRTRQQDFVRALAPYGVRGILSGAGFLLKTTADWRMLDGLPIYQNLGLVGSVDRTVKLIKAAAANAKRPLFLNIYCVAWSMSPSNLKQVKEQLDDSYEVVLPRTLLTMLGKPT
jgi:hypothetical protein